ncbi:hypothetical protein CEXT_607201 [Caerostris extrusa]|uniref:Uncharacterized protein n=1 Tax=Caerostris extrusa TaxID=172846 RepID=A0AAV4VFC6_CAEEX|nr:hypothetical protein CEXT_607201 [Caerostris extrusa]
MFLNKNFGYLESIQGSEKLLPGNDVIVCFVELLRPRKINRRLCQIKRPRSRYRRVWDQYLLWTLCQGAKCEIPLFCTIGEGDDVIGDLVRGLKRSLSGEN